MRVLTPYPLNCRTFAIQAPHRCILALANVRHLLSALKYAQDPNLSHGTHRKAVMHIECSRNRSRCSCVRLASLHAQATATQCHPE
jgi:hypothetical protein